MTFFPVDSPNEEDRKRYLHLVTLLLPKGNRDTMEVLFFFLKWVASFSHVDYETGNKMDLHNLATVISPNIFRSYAKNGSDAVRLESFESIRVMDTLLEHQDEIYAVPEEFIGLLRDQEYFAGSLELPSKDILKRVDMYLKAKANGPLPMLSSPTQVAGPFGPAASGNFGLMNREDGDSRLASQKSDSMLTRGRPEGNRPTYAATQSVDRPQLQTAASENLLRNGQTHSRRQSPHSRYPQNGQPHSRQQSPQSRGPHPQFIHPISSSPTSLSLGAAAAAVGSGPITPNANANANAQVSDNDWAALQRSPQLPSSLPNSRPLSYVRKDSGDNALLPGQSPAVI